MRIFILLLSLLLLTIAPAQAQGLISGPSEEGLLQVQKWESLRQDALIPGRPVSLHDRAVYGSIVWELANAYEGCSYWEDAFSARNEFNDLQLPPGALEDCADCPMRCGEEVLAIDRQRLESKVQVVEEVDHVKIDRCQRLPAVLEPEQAYRWRSAMLQFDHWLFQLKYSFIETGDKLLGGGDLLFKSLWRYL